MALLEEKAATVNKLKEDASDSHLSLNVGLGNITWRLYSFQGKCLLVFRTILIACKSVTFLFQNLVICYCVMGPLMPFDLNSATLGDSVWSCWASTFLSEGLRTLMSGNSKNNTFWWNWRINEGKDVTLFLITLSVRVTLHCRCLYLSNWHTDCCVYVIL